MKIERTKNAARNIVLDACISFAVPNIFFFIVYGRNPLFRESISQIRHVLLKTGV